MPAPAADTLPNAFLIDDPPVVSDKRLDGWPISLYEDCCDELTFRHNFNLEASDSDPNVGFDGAVLEMSTDGGNTFQDVVAVGGRFIKGGYNRVIATDRGSPIAGRQAWSGNSGGFITTVVGLPSNVLHGLLRWRMASDNSGGNEGWRVDTLHMSWCQGMGTPCPTPTPTATPPLCDAIYNGNFETGSFIPWVVDSSSPAPFVSNLQAHSGNFSSHLGSLPEAEMAGDSSFYQTIRVPADGSTLRFWYWPRSTDNISSDCQQAYVQNASGVTLRTLLHTCENIQTWIEVLSYLGEFAGQTVRIKFLVHGRNNGDSSDMFIDDVTLLEPCPRVTPRPRPTPAPRP